MNRYNFEDLEPGHKESFNVTVTKEAMESFQALTGDVNPLHGDEQFAREKGYEGRVAYGMLTASFLSTLAGVYLPGERSLIQGVNIKFSAPVYIGDELEVTGEVSEKNDTFRVLTVKVSIRNGSGKKVLKGSMQIGVME